MSKKRLIKWHDLGERQTNKDFSATSHSPYWDALLNGKAEHGEPDRANPDVLPESAAAFPSGELSDEAQDRLDSIVEVFPKLSDQQKKVVYLCGVEGYSLGDAAKALGIKKGAAQSLLKRAQAVIKEHHDKKSV